MSMLARYKKPGGFDQLLTLLEKSVPKKQEALLLNVESEDPSFAKLLKAKILTAKQIFTWDPVVIGEATSKMSGKQLSILIKAMGEGEFEKATCTLKPILRKEIQEALPHLTVNPGEFEACQIVLIEKVRDAIKAGTIKLDDCNTPTLLKNVS